MENRISEIFSGYKFNYKLALSNPLFNIDEGRYVTTIHLDKFNMNLILYMNKDKIIKYSLIDNEFGEEIDLPFIKDAYGNFINSIREEITKKLIKFRDIYFINTKADYHKLIKEYVYKKYGDEEEFLWQKFPKDSIIRRKDNKKRYILFMYVPLNKFGYKEDRETFVLDIRCEENKIVSMVDNKTFFKAYHMNKKHWISVIFNNEIDLKEIYKLIDESYNLAI